MRVIEDLAHEHRLSRLSASILIEAVLRQVGANGEWVGMPPRSGREVVLPAEMASWVHHFWR